jgi:hypothetical protein
MQKARPETVGLFRIFSLILHLAAVTIPTATDTSQLDHQENFNHAPATGV